MDSGQKLVFDHLLSRHYAKQANGGPLGTKPSKPREWIEAGTGAVVVEKLALYGWLQKHKARKGNVTRYKTTNSPLCQLPAGKVMTALSKTCSAK